MNRAIQEAPITALVGVTGPKQPDKVIVHVLRPNSFNSIWKLGMITSNMYKVLLDVRLMFICRQCFYTATNIVIKSLTSQLTLLVK